jgi:hypothetical protein
MSELTLTLSLALDSIKGIDIEPPPNATNKVEIACLAE